MEGAQKGRLCLALKILLFSRFYDSLLDECLGLTERDLNDSKDDMKVLMKEKGLKVDMSPKQVKKIKTLNERKIRNYNCRNQVL